MLVAQPRVSMVLVTALGITTGAQGVRNAQLESMAKIGARAHFAAQEHFKTKPGNIFDVIELCHLRARIK